MLSRLYTYFFGADRRSLTASGQSVVLSYAQTLTDLTPPPVFGVAGAVSSAAGGVPDVTLRPVGLVVSDSSSAAGAGVLSLSGAGLVVCVSTAWTGTPTLLPGGRSVAVSVANAEAGVLSLRPLGIVWSSSLATADPDLDFDGELEASGEIRGVSWAGACLPTLANVFIVYVMEGDSPGVVVAVLDGSAGNGSFSLDLSGLLPAGRWTLGVRKVDQYGTPGELAELVIQVGDGGEAVTLFVTAQLIEATTWADGMIGLQWQAALGGVPGTRLGDSVQRPAAAWEIAEASQTGVVLATVSGGPGGSRKLLSTLLGPFVDGVTVRLVIRASDGVVDGERGPWTSVPAVVVDDLAPAVPVGWDCGLSR